jgi:hypothetical protein
MPVGKALGLWAAATIGVGITAWAASDVIGLPDWVLPGSLGVMLAGLPAIGVTAFVQRAAHQAYTTTPQRTPGGTPSAQGTLATLALKASPKSRGAGPGWVALWRSEPSRFWWSGSW